MTIILEPKQFSYIPPWYNYLSNFILALLPLILLNANRENFHPNIFEWPISFSGMVGYCAAIFAIYIILRTLLAIYYGTKPNRSIIFSSTAITAPTSLNTGNIITINYSEIISIHKPGFLNGNKLTVNHNGGKLKIDPKGFEIATTTTEIYEQLKQATQL